MKLVVYDYLHYGKENAIRTKDLAKALGFRSVRDLQKQIELERAAGAVIISDSHGAGYYLSDDPVELRRFVQTLKARAKNTMNAVESARRALDAATGQESIEGGVRCIKAKKDRLGSSCSFIKSRSLTLCRMMLWERL